MKKSLRKMIVFLLLLTIGTSQQVYGKGKDFKTVEVIKQTHSIVAKQHQTIELDSTLVKVNDASNGNKNKNVKLYVQDGEGYTHEKNKVKILIEEGTVRVPITVKREGRISEPFIIKIDVIKPRELFFLTNLDTISFEQKSLEGWEVSDESLVSFISSGLDTYKGNAVSVTVNDKIVMLQTKNDILKAKKGYSYTLNFYGKKRYRKRKNFGWVYKRR